MLTGRAGLTVTIGAVNNGGVAKFLTKPCDAEIVADIIRDELFGKAAADAV
jgi:FixJ family two-component response regulator